MNIADVQHHPLWDAAIDQQTGFSTRNILCCCISDGAGKNMAVLSVRLIEIRCVSPNDGIANQPPSLSVSFYGSNACHSYHI